MVVNFGTTNITSYTAENYRDTEVIMILEYLLTIKREGPSVALMYSELIKDMVL